MNFETVSLLLSWVELGVLLAILGSAKEPLRRLAGLDKPDQDLR